MTSKKSPEKQQSRLKSGDPKKRNLQFATSFGSKTRPDSKRKKKEVKGKNIFNTILQVNKITIQPVFNNIIIQTGPVVVESSPERPKSEKLLHKDPLTAVAFATFMSKAADIEQSEEIKGSKKHCLSRRAKPRKESRRHNHQEPSPPAPLSRDSSNENTLC